MASLCMSGMNLRTSSFNGAAIQSKTRQVCAPVKQVIEAAKVVEGIVVSASSAKTVSVKVNSSSPHPLYKKRVVTSKKFSVHDEESQCAVGDRVRIEPLGRSSKTFFLGVEDGCEDNCDALSIQTAEQLRCCLFRASGFLVSVENFTSVVACDVLNG
ncbi:hypothetical protein CYMTET_45969 [Cymbomonas tetramitiformis]|uniref:30S ribosomal protein S17, chloroplastic n=1 Tax=Cymbomonas tetramitiformis TaxID=36881 RepID=A0AAE0BYJ2_9CHLO|nr:hypothetical protein CYMTET_45969 [Cymbomonas tetramitiformis]